MSTKVHSVPGGTAPGPLTNDVDGSESKKPFVSAKVSYISTNKTYISVKEPFIAA